MASETKQYGAILERELIFFTGHAAEQEEFLQSLVTNDVSAAAPDRLVYAALLTPQGKYLSDFLLRRTADGDFVLDAAPAQTEALQKRLTMYKLRRPVQMERRTAQVAVIWGGDVPDGGIPDPRDPALGWRLYENPGAAVDDLPSGDYDLHRLRLAVPESDADLIANDTYILEAGFERLSGVDFKKGCYVGQEIVARMKHKTELRKGYALVSLSDPVSQGETILNHENKPSGVIFSNRDGVGLALLRFDRVHSAESLAAAHVSVKPIQSK